MEFNNFFLSLGIWVLLFACNQKSTEDLICEHLSANDFMSILDGKSTSLYELNNGDLSIAITNYGGFRYRKIWKDLRLSRIICLGNTIFSRFTQLE